MRAAIVHYHLDPGGVTRVIESASRVLTAAGVRQVILTGGCGVPPQAVPGASRPEVLPARHVEGLGYLTNPGALTAEKLTATLRATVTDALGGPPDVWHFHNHSLGKNCLIPDVIARLAEAGERLVLQIHDLAEQGRPANYQLISRYRDIYPFSPRIRYAFLNTRDLALFTSAGLPPENAILLPNPIAPTLTSRLDSSSPQDHELEAGRIEHGLRRDAAATSSPALLFAPIRGIRRKNLGELVLLAALAPAGTRVAVSRAPRNPDALPVHDTWQKFSATHRLPIGFDVVDRFTPAAGAGSDFESWLAHATHIVTTSVSEGFGLPFLESIAQGKPLLGRDLPHLAADHGIRFPHLYQRILIPVDWVDLTILESHLATTLERNFRLYRRPLHINQVSEVLATLVHGELLDFGNLPEPLQQGIIEKLAEFANRRIPLVEIGGNTFPLEEWLAETLTHREPAATPDQLAPWSLENYQNALAALYQDLAARPAAPIRHVPAEKILTAHLAADSFHFLLSALEPKPAPVKFRAVVFDIYGTLLIAPSGGVRPDPLIDPMLREIVRQAGYEPTASPSTDLHAAVLRHHAAAGVPFPEIDLRILWREILDLPHDTDTTALVQATEEAWHPATPMPGAEKFIYRLAASGLSLGLLSNAQCNTLAALGPISDLFAPELTILSYQHGIAKPAPELFQILTDRLAGRGITPAETLFIGNDPLHDIAPAAAAGFLTALFTGHPDSLRPGHCSPDFTLEKWAEFKL
ncbi:MAG: HAD family hydrolase [Verrucomicrobiota bacterium]